MSQSDLSLRTGLTEKTISQIINGVAPISYDTALKLEAALGLPARVWNNLERNYQEAKAEIERAKKLEESLDWLSTIGVKTLSSQGLISPTKDKVELLQKVLHFFGVSDVDAWHRVWPASGAAFRRSRTRELKWGLVATWIRMGELAAESTECEAYDADRFRLALKNLRGLSIQPPAIWQDKMVADCAAAGVAVAFIPAIPGAGISGMTKWLSKDKALIQLSNLYRNDGAFWFTFFHEAGHVLLHGKKDIFLEGNEPSEDQKEREADQFARNLLIPRDRASELRHLRDADAIKSFARSIGVSPGIVVGRLQHDKLAFRSAYNPLKKKVEWS
jgi:plasmid maintenance system antidote protein VapI